MTCSTSLAAPAGHVPCWRDRYRVAGLAAGPAMLALAATNFPAVEFHLADRVGFNLGQDFGVPAEQLRRLEGRSLLFEKKRLIPPSAARSGLTLHTQTNGGTISSQLVLLRGRFRPD